MSGVESSPNVFPFPAPDARSEVEEGTQLQPKFAANGLIPCITQDVETNEILMVAYMNDLALSLTIQTGLAHYWSRSRQKLWKKGESSGRMQKVEELRIDCDQDCVLIKVKIDDASCHTGYKSCFFRKLSDLSPRSDLQLDYVLKEKLFDPKEVYGK